MSRGDACRIPFVPDHSMALVEVALSTNLKRRLLIDTGALVTTMSWQTAGLLGVDLERPTRWQYLIGVDGHRRRIPMVNPGRLAVGAVVLPAREVAVVDLPPIFRADGLLGLDVLRRFRVTLEFDTRHLILRPS